MESIAYNRGELQAGLFVFLPLFIYYFHIETTRQHQQIYREIFFNTC